ncbi:1820_t:CDS:2 [Ambispora gerdemannii]|uniref:1820_t:CDS:1 n=1 Tax=Ambispora gerdemannii TaxID=144530 RepID=A0A9N9BE54_9GLOM|nr:1820_t:CDS:2 [Ambispora gerdemannii]
MFQSANQQLRREKGKKDLRETFSCATLQQTYQEDKHFTVLGLMKERDT